MTPAEALILCRMAKGACPQQAFDEFTPDMWHDLMKETRFEDAKEALVTIVKRQPFVAPSEILSEVRKIREKRIADYGPFDPPPEVENYNRWLGEMRRRIADGEDPVQRLELVEKPMPELGSVFRVIEAHDQPSDAETAAYHAKAQALADERAALKNQPGGER